MLLEKLVEYADRLDPTPYLYVKSPARYLIRLGIHGNLLGQTEPEDTASKEEKRGGLRLLPTIARSSGIKPLLLADKADYTFGWAKSDTPKDQHDAIARHEAYMILLETCFEKTQDSAVGAVLTFLKGKELSQLKRPEDFDLSGLITFIVDGSFVVDSLPVQRFWAGYNNPDNSESAGVIQMQCLICGQVKPVLERLQGKIKGVPGGQPAGTSIISANANAFESYGLEASLIAPTCADCGDKFTKGLNHLLANSNKQSRITVNNSAYVVWTREEVAFSGVNMLSDPEPQQVIDLLSSVSTSKQQLAFTEEDSVAFYAANLAGNNARAVIRDWIDTTVGEVKKNTARWFALQRIIGPYGEAPFLSEFSKPYGLYTLAATTVREGKDITSNVTQVITRTAFTGSELPGFLLQMVVNRCRAEQKVNRPHAALLKMVLLSKDPNFKEDPEYMVELNFTRPEPIYHCGRLLFLLEEAQRQAIPGLENTLVDRYYGAASSSPARVFGPLLRNLQNHLSKLEGDSSKKGIYYRLQQQIGEVMEVITDFPRTVKLEEQALFALGYYHQRAHNRTRAIEAKKMQQGNQNED